MSILDDFENLCKGQDDSVEVFLYNIVEMCPSPKILSADLFDEWINHNTYRETLKEDDYMTKTTYKIDRETVYIIPSNKVYPYWRVIVGTPTNFKLLNEEEWNQYNNLFLKKYVKNPARDFHKLPSHRILSMSYKRYDCTII